MEAPRPGGTPVLLAGLVPRGACYTARCWASLLRLDGLAPTGKRGVCAGCTLTVAGFGTSSVPRGGRAAAGTPAAAAPVAAPKPSAAKRPRTRGGAPAPPEDQDAAHVDVPDGADFGDSASKEKRREESSGARVFMPIIYGWARSRGWESLIGQR